jgi:hypothetical protein
MNTSIVSALYSQATSMAQADAQLLRQMLNVAASGLSAEEGEIKDARRRAAVDTLLATLFRLGAGAHDLPRDGVRWVGRPDFVTDTMISQLVQLSLHAAPGRVPRGSHTFVECPAVWDLLPQAALMGLLHDVHQDHLRLVERAPTFQYFDAAGQRAEPHVDVEEFALTCLLLIRHDGAEKRSKSWVFPAGEAPRIVELAVGDMLLLHGNAVVHERTPVIADEFVTTLGIGFTLREPAAGQESRS